MTEKAASGKSAGAYRTISEVAADLDLPQHVLRFWETRFPQVRPLKRAGGRRFYRPEDVALLRGIRAKLYDEGYTIKGVQRLLRERGGRERPSGFPGAGDGPVHGADRELINGIPAPGAGEETHGDVEASAGADREAACSGIPAETLTKSPSDGTAQSLDVAALRDALAIVDACERRLRVALSSSS